MYAWLFRHLPGPVWLKVIESLIIVMAVLYLLFEHVYPWAQNYLNLADNSV
ncbi:hypothetical protein [Schaalia canis]|uniref:hypothetical protein n=1 Tax=Schaalia canis TaxID=100469 RepID=UPI001402122C|nr:hypothetical protein [Schaalia canis]